MTDTTDRGNLARTFVFQAAALVLLLDIALAANGITTDTGTTWAGVLLAWLWFVLVVGGAIRALVDAAGGDPE